MNSCNMLMRQNVHKVYIFLKAQRWYNPSCQLKCKKKRNLAVYISLCHWNTTQWGPIQRRFFPFHGMLHPSELLVSGGAISDPTYSMLHRSRIPILCQRIVDERTHVKNDILPVRKKCRANFEVTFLASEYTLWNEK